MMTTMLLGTGNTWRKPWLGKIAAETDSIAEQLSQQILEDSMVKHIAFTVYPVTDMLRARAFYEGDLGLKPSMDFEGKWVDTSRPTAVSPSPR